MREQPEGTYNIMRKFRIKEISGVRAGAMGEGSNFAIIKRRDDIEKKAALTDPMDGHAHVLHGIDDAQSGVTSYGGEGPESPGHSHQWIIGMNGEIIVGAEQGHTHRVGFFSKQRTADVLDETHSTLEQLSARSETSDPADESQEDDTMNEDQFKTELEQLQKSLDEANARAEKAEAISAMTDVQKAFYQELEGEAAESFLKSEDKDGEIEKANEADPVVATTEDGVEIRKSQDPTGLLTQMVEKAKKEKKRFQELEEEKEKEAKKAADAELSKRAAELTNLPGTEEQHVEMLKALDTIEDEEMRKAAHAALVAKNNELASAFEEVGTLGQPELKSDDEKLEALAKAEMERDESLTFEQAYTKALESEEGLEVYSKRLEG